MTLRLLVTPAAFVFGVALLAPSAPAQTRPAVPQSPYGGVTVEDIVARVNDQIITQSDYDRAMKEMDQEGKQQGLSMQQISERHRDLLRSLIDQQLWLSKRQRAWNQRRNLSSSSASTRFASNTTWSPSRTWKKPPKSKASLLRTSKPRFATTSSRSW